jgi:hypothetical protein
LFREVAVAGMFLLLLLMVPATQAVPLTSAAITSTVEVAGIYESTQSVSQHFWQNVSNGLYGQSTAAVFSTGLPLAHANATAVTVILTVVTPDELVARANVTQSSSVIYNYTVPYQVGLYGVVVNGSNLIEHTVNLSTVFGIAPSNGEYSLTVELTLDISYTQNLVATWAHYGNDSYSDTETVKAPSTGSLNFTSYIGGTGITIPFPVAMNLSTLKVYVGAKLFSNYQWTTGSVTVVPPNLAPSASETLQVWVQAAPIITGAIPVLTFSYYYSDGAGGEYSNVSWFNNRTTTYGGFYLIEYSLPYLIEPTTLTIQVAGKSIAPSSYTLSGTVITLFPGAYALKPGLAVVFVLHYHFLNAPPSLSILDAASVVGAFTVGDVLLFLMVAFIGYVLFIGFSPRGKAMFPSRLAWRNRLIEMLVAFAAIGGFYVWGLVPR